MFDFFFMFVNFRERIVLVNVMVLRIKVWKCFLASSCIGFVVIFEDGG